MTNPSKRVQWTKEAMEAIEYRGQIRQDKVYNFLQKLYQSYSEFDVYNNSGSHAGPDILITKNGQPFAVIEVTNYKQSSFMSWQRLYRYIKNLERFSCHRILILSYPENLRFIYNNSYRTKMSDSERIQGTEKLLAKHGINVSYFGYQD